MLGEIYEHIPNTKLHIWQGAKQSKNELNSLLIIFQKSKSLWSKKCLHELFPLHKLIKSTSLKYLWQDKSFFIQVLAKYKNTSYKEKINYSNQILKYSYFKSPEIYIKEREEIPNSSKRPA